MQIEFQSRDFGAFVLGREVLKRFPAAEVKFVVKKNIACEGEVTSPRLPGVAIQEGDFWERALMQILDGGTRFGRIGIFFDRQDVEAKEFFTKLDVSKWKYSPIDRRAEKTPKISLFETQLIHHIADEGCADSVEFRRLARKYIRPAKHARCDVIFFPEAILGAEKTVKILQHIAGTQMKCRFVSEFVLTDEIVKVVEKSKKQKIEIESGDDGEFTRQRGEGVLRVKFKK